MSSCCVTEDVSWFASQLRTCGHVKDLNKARHLHDKLRASHHCNNRFLSNLIVEMYGKCGSLHDAFAAFEQIHNKNLISFNLMLRAYTQNGDKKQATCFIQRMDLEGLHLDVCSFITALGSCSSVSDAKKLHRRIAAAGLDTQNVVVGTALIKMFGCLGEVDESRSIFDAMNDRNDVTLTTMIVAYSQNGYCSEAREILKTMTDPSVVAWTSIMAGYGKIGDFQQAEYVFETMQWRDVVAWTTMVTVFVHKRDVVKAKNLFDRMPERSVVSWNAMLGAYVEADELHEAKSLFDLIPRPDDVSWAMIFAAYVSFGELQNVRSLFQQLPQRSLESWNCMIAVLARNGRMEEARNVFESLSARDSISWRNTIAGYAKLGKLTESRELLLRMPSCDCYCVNLVLAAYVKARECRGAVRVFREVSLGGAANLESVLAVVFEACSAKEAKMFAQSAREAGVCLDVVATNALINLYGKCLRLGEAKAVFDSMTERDAVSWNTMVAAYIQNQELDLARRMFDSMPDQNTVAWTSMVSGYAQNGRIAEAKAMFERIPERNIVSWNAMIVAYNQNGHPKEAYVVFQLMDLEGEEADQVTLVAALDACAGIPIVIQGKLLHSDVVDKGWEGEVVMSNALINMYGKCGHPEQARQIFDDLTRKDDVVTWTSMITAYAQNGFTQEAIELFKAMTFEGVQANDVTVVSVLSACSHSGVAGWECFSILQADYGIRPQAEHFACMIDQLGRAGWIHGAEQLIDNMPFEPDVVARTTMAAYECSSSATMTRLPHSYVAR